MRRDAIWALAALGLTTGVASQWGCAGREQHAAEQAAEDVAEALEPAVPVARPIGKSPAWGEANKDDGTAESGYGFVPSATEGIYVQEFAKSDFAHPYVNEVCLCLLKTRGEPTASFDIVFYEATDANPADQPYATVQAMATGLAQSKEVAGEFHCVDTGRTAIPEDRFFIGARWNPKQNGFLFICNDQTPAAHPAPVFFREDRATGWTSVFNARDPIFGAHQAILVRARSTE